MRKPQKHPMYWQFRKEFTPQQAKCMCGQLQGNYYGKYDVLYFLFKSMAEKYRSGNLALTENLITWALMVYDEIGKEDPLLEGATRKTPLEYFKSNMFLLFIRCEKKSSLLPDSASFSDVFNRVEKEYRASL